MDDGSETVADPAASEAQRLGAAWLTSYLESLLFQIQPKDPIAFVGVPLL